jgi:hypothetical protein
MKYITILFSALVLAACDTMPVIVPDNTSDNVVMMQLKDSISQPGPTPPSFGWVIWYFPVAVISMMAAWRYLIKKPVVCEEDKDGDGYVDPQKPKQQ